MTSRHPVLPKLVLTLAAALCLAQALGRKPQPRRKQFARCRTDQTQQPEAQSGADKSQLSDRQRAEQQLKRQQESNGFWEWYRISTPPMCQNAPPLSPSQKFHLM